MSESGTGSPVVSRLTFHGLSGATINHLTFTTYFGNAPLLEIVGRTFPVQVGLLQRSSSLRR